MVKHILFLVVFLSTFCFAQFYGGSGTTADPYLIKTASSLDSIRFYPEGYAFRQIADIDLSGIANWLPIGNQDTVFTGNYDGGGYIISNLTITSVPEYSNRFHAGLFGKIGGQSIAGIDSVHFIAIHLQNVDITGAYANGAGDLFFAGGVVGEIALSVASTRPTILDSCRVDTIDIKVTGSRTHSIGGIVGNINTGTYGQVFQCGVEEDSLTQSTNGANQHYVGGLVGFKSSTAFSIFESWTKNSYIYGNRTANYLGGFVGNHDQGNITDCYVYEAEVIDNSSTIATLYFAGTFVGGSTATTTRCYAQGTTVYNQDLSAKTGFVGNMGGAGSANFFDKEVAGTSNTNIDSTVACVVYPQLTDSMKTKETFIWRGWDYDTTWATSLSVNDGYPNLESVFYVGYTIGYPSSTGLAFLQDSVITIWWNTDVPALTENGTDTTFVWYKLNGSLTFIDTVFNNDTTLSWTVPSGIYSETGAVFVNNVDSSYSDSSNYFFTVIPLPSSYSHIEIFNADPSTFESSLDTVIIYVESSNVDSFRIHWSTDSLTWNYITKTAVDTANGFFKDTTTVQWFSPPLIYGKVYLRAQEYRDTTLTYGADTTLYAGKRVVASNSFYITETFLMDDCSGGTYSVGGADGLLRLLAIWDPSSGWNSNVTWRFYQVTMHEDLTTGVPEYGSSYIVCEACQRQCLRDANHELICTGGCIFPTFGYWMIKDTTGYGYYAYGADSTLVSGDYGHEEQGTQIFIDNRRYFLEKVGDKYYIKVADLLNSYTQVYSEYTNAVNTGASGSDKLVDDISYHSLATYSRPLSTMSAIRDTVVVFGTTSINVLYHSTGEYDKDIKQKLVDSLDVNFGDFNKGYVLVGDVGAGYRNTYYVSLLPEPVYQLNLAEDVWESTGISVRNYFRGIHPKILKQ